MQPNANPPNAPVRRAPGWAAVIIVGVAIVTSGCRPSPTAGQSAPPPPPEVGIVVVSNRVVRVSTELPGRLTAVREAQVRARATGILEKRLFVEGAEVKAGDVLVQIDPKPLQAALDSARAALAKAEAHLQQSRATAARFGELVKIHAVSQEQDDEARATLGTDEADVLAAKAAVETAELNLGYATVTAPISGRIGRALVTEGALVSQAEATQLATIQQLDPIYLDFTQSSTEVLRLKRALSQGRLEQVAPNEARVTLLLEDGTVYEQEGRLLFAEVTVDPTTGMITLRSEFPNPDHLLLPGMFARVRLEQAVDRQAITVSQRAVVRGANDTASVLVVLPDDTVAGRNVKTGVAVGDEWIITDGLKAGDRVIVEGLQKARPGAKVRPVPFGASPANESSPADRKPAAAGK
jgi:membrane fusion protein (multidrug efflux system)